MLFGTGNILSIHHTSSLHSPWYIPDELLALLGEPLDSSNQASDPGLPRTFPIVLVVVQIARLRLSGPNSSLGQTETGVLKQINILESTLVHGNPN